MSAIRTIRQISGAAVDPVVQTATRHLQRFQRFSPGPLGDVDATNYTSSGLVDSLHALPHYDFQFKKVLNTFTTTDPRYFESLAQIGIPIGVVGVLLTLGLICCMCRRRKSGSASFATKPVEIRLRDMNRKIMCGALVTLILVVISFFGNDRVAEGVELFRDQTQVAQSLYDAAMTSSQTLAEDSKTTVATLDSKGLPEESIAAMKATLGSVSSTAAAIDAFSSYVDTKAMLDALDQYEGLRMTATILFHLLLLALALVFFVSAFVHKMCLRGIATVSAPVLVLLGLILVGVHLAFAVGVADFCADPNLAISAIISPGSDSNSSCAVPDDDACIAAYFINCPEDEASPFAPQFAAASQGVVVAFEELLEIENATRTDLSDVYRELLAMNASIAALASEIGCAPLHNSYISAVGGICDQSLSGFVIMMVVVSFIAVALMISAVYTARIPQISAGSKFGSRSGAGALRYKDTDPLVDTSYAESFCQYHDPNGGDGGYGAAPTGLCHSNKKDGSEFCIEHSCPHVVKYTTLQRPCNRAKAWRAQFCEKHQP